MNRTEQLSVLETLLYLSEHPLTVEQLVPLFGTETSPAELRELLDELVDVYESRNLQIQRVAGGYQLSTREEYAEWIQKFRRIEKSSKLTRPSLETLSIVSYKQPLTRAEIEDIRGVDSLGVLKTLMNHNLIKIMGRKKVPGRPVLYGTTKRFLEYFGLASLSELPTLQEFEKSIGPFQEELQYSESIDPDIEGKVEPTDPDLEGETDVEPELDDGGNQNGDAPDVPAEVRSAENSSPDESDGEPENT